MVYATGIGIVGPGGNNVETFWDSLLNLRNAMSIQKIDNGQQSIMGGFVENIRAEDFFQKRLLKKCARFSVLSLLACREALISAKINLDKVDLEKVGIFIANNSGGWEKANEGLRTIYEDGIEYVSPYLASNWFPAAVQGHLSLEFGFRGFSKTIISDRCSGLHTISYAKKMIEKGIIDIAVVGGVETPLDSWSYQFYKSSGMLAEESEGYHPFDKRGAGLIMAEGAAFLILESSESVSSRKIKDNRLATIDSYAMSFSGSTDNNLLKKQYINTIEKAFKNTQTQMSDIDLISLEGTGNIIEDEVEIGALRDLCNEHMGNSIAYCPKSYFGHSIGAAGVFDTIISILSMKNSYVIPINDCENDAPFLATSLPVGKNIKNTLLLSRGFGGAASALIIGNIGGKK